MRIAHRSVNKSNEINFYNLMYVVNLTIRLCSGHVHRSLLSCLDDVLGSITLFVIQSIFFFFSITL